MANTLRCYGFWIGLLVLSFVLAAPARAQQLPEILRENRWKKRIVLLYAPTSDDKLLLRQRALLAQRKSGQQERDMLVLEAIGPQLSATERQYLRTKLGLSSGGFAMLLIGKDGGVKHRENEPVKPETLFSLIDTMPMRRQEMLR